MSMKTKTSAQKPDSSAEDDQVVVSIEHMLTAGQDHAVFSGKVHSTGNAVLGIAATPLDCSTPQLSTATLSKLCIVPKNISPHKACTYTAALLAARAIIRHEFGIELTSSHRRPDRRRAEPPSGRRIVVVGGETSLGAALTQILVRVRPDARVVVSSSLSDQRVLFQRTSHLVGLGAWYAIDGALPDLMEYAGLGDENGLEVIFNATKGMDVREDLAKVGKVVECSERDARTVPESPDTTSSDSTGVVYEMLREAADVMAQYVEPSESCEFADEGA